MLARVLACLDFFSASRSPSRLLYRWVYLYRRLPMLRFLVCRAHISINQVTPTPADSKRTQTGHAYVAHLPFCLFDLVDGLPNSVLGLFVLLTLASLFLPSRRLLFRSHIRSFSRQCSASSCSSKTTEGVPRKSLLVCRLAVDLLMVVAYRLPFSRCVQSTPQASEYSQEYI